MVPAKLRFSSSTPSVSRRSAMVEDRHLRRSRRSPSLLVLFPIYWMVITSLKLPREIYRHALAVAAGLHLRTTIA